jgi:hypothetical protein
MHVVPLDSGDNFVVNESIDIPPAFMSCRTYVMFNPHNYILQFDSYDYECMDFKQGFDNARLNFTYNNIIINPHIYVIHQQLHYQILPLFLFNCHILTFYTNQDNKYFYYFWYNNLSFSYNNLNHLILHFIHFSLCNKYIGVI